jgi:sugar phosphate isomerase/epimerase
VSIRLAYLAAPPESAPFPFGWNGELERIIPRLAAIGYEGVELQVRDASLVDRAALAKIAGGAGMSISGFGTAPITFDKLHLVDADPNVRLAAVERLKNMLELAGSFGVDVSVGRFRGMVKTAPERETGIGWLRAALEACLPLAERLGNRIVLEPMNRGVADFLNTIAETIVFIDSFGSASLSYEADLHHQAGEETSLLASLVRGQRSGRMSYVQVSDSNRRAPGWGCFNWTDIIETLRASGYDGWLAVECLQHPGSDQCAVQAHAVLRRILEGAPN